MILYSNIYVVKYVKVFKITEEGNGNPLQYSCQDNPTKRRSLVGNSPWCHKESDTTEQLNNTHTK